ncbi:FG-GAP-like repeat-containing protein [Luteimonas saliphila]|uniref:FG-GAP-like repeat-containing protein n=1 Tax=Luteimonas saliphila TaxID=2804919 RepID=UPI00192D6694|nr:FG-GAP-like repeat-containing protein [Luteimonas saliphila]
MRKHLLGLVLIAALAGCTSESDSGRDTALGAVAPREPVTDVPTAPSLAALRGSSASFASLPDRGELLSYGGARKSRQSGAYTYHPVAISEAHALNAIGSGEMVVNTPDGEALRLKYERHEEQPDGNWTWIGRNHDGSSAVLTFGGKAVFGMISRGDDYYRVRTDRTGAWVVETDRSLVASGGGRREKGPDFLVPPESGALTAAASRRLAKAAPSADVPEKAAAVVDVLIGYSNGLASVYGSQSAAATFVTSLAAITNAAYANSGVSMRLRVVHTLQVNYADNSDNQDALQQLTGYNANTQQPITPNAAFNALRAARNEYGADLVAFVRQYREPEQDGCGIAWLLGMNQSGISAANDAEFGYAVVSDGEDRDEGDGNTYFCSDYSLAHELGHLMGQAHNTQDAQGRAGAHTYSYGYRESSASGFFTIMAYPSGDAQLEIPHFGNPSVLYQSRPTGSATADNVRSMNITMPIISGFRQTVVPVGYTRNDVDANGFSDILWFNQGARYFAYWRMSGATQLGSASFGNITAGYTVPGTGDFNGDGRADVLWINTTQRKLYVWLANTAGAFGSRHVADYPAGWALVGTGDVNADGKTDLFWFNATTRQMAYWLMDGTRIVGSRTFGNVSTGFTVAGIGDFNGDGRADVLWTHPTQRSLYLWQGTVAGAYTSTALPSYPAGWQVAGVGDVTADGRADIVWMNPTSRQFGYWQMTGASVTRSTTFNNIAAGYSVASVADFNGDGRDDILWSNPSLRELYVWYITPSHSFQSFRVGTYPAGWAIIP